MKLLPCICFIFFLGSTSLQAQNFWRTYTEKEGLIDNKVLDIATTSGAIYLATPQGFSVFRDNQFTNYDTSKGLPDQNIKQLAGFGDTIWMVTDSGISRFYQGIFTHFTVRDGLYTDSINDIVVDGRGTLWLATYQGLQTITANTIANISTKNTYTLAYLGGDSILANVNFPSITNMSSPVTMELYDGNNWSAVVDQSLVGFIGNPKLIATKAGEVFALSGKHGVYKITWPFKVVKIPLKAARITVSNIADLVTSSGAIWVAYGRDNSLYGTRGGLIKHDAGKNTEFINGLPSTKIYSLDQSENKIVIGSDAGFGISSDSSMPFPIDDTITTSRLALVVNSDGSLGADYRVNSFSFLGLNYPRGSRSSLLWKFSFLNSGFIRGRRDLHLAVDYNGTDFKEGTINTANAPMRPNMYRINRNDINYHLKNFRHTNYKMPASIRDWPANGIAEMGEAVDQAPFVDVDEDGCYNPYAGDYPYILGDEAVLVITNDLNPYGKSAPDFNMEIQMMVYVFNQHQVDHLQHSVFVRYTLINRSKRQYDMHSGFYFDADLGNVIDDYSGSLPQEYIVYAYNADDYDDTMYYSSGSPTYGYGAYPPVLGYKYINRKMYSFMDYDVSSILPGRGDFPFVNNHFHYSLKGLWNDSTPVSYGGSGYDPSATNLTRFMFNGDPRKPNEWSRIHLGKGVAPYQGDNKTISSIEPYLFEPGDRKVIDLVMGVGLDSTNTGATYLDNIDVLTEYLNKSAAFQKQIVKLSPPITYSNCFIGLEKTQKRTMADVSVNIFPNPAKEFLTIQTNFAFQELRLIDVQGREVWRKKVPATSDYKLVISSEITSGIHVLQILTEKGLLVNRKLILR
jgi:hypothetical protein